MRAYGLDDVIELWDPGSEEALFKEVLQATKERRAWLGFMWSPAKPHQLWLLQDWLSQIAKWVETRKTVVGMMTPG